MGVQGHVASYPDATLYAGPDQTNAAFEFWRFYANHIVEWKGDDLTIAGSYDIGTENIANRPGSPRAFVTGGGRRGAMACGGPMDRGGADRKSFGIAMVAGPVRSNL